MCDEEVGYLFGRGDDWTIVRGDWFAFVHVAQTEVLPGVFRQLISFIKREEESDQ